jgi:hypothetical protein
MDGEWRNRRRKDWLNYKNQKTHKINKGEQYREILQENPTKTKYKGK